MPIINIEENIKQAHTKIESLAHEISRLEGMLTTFEGFKKGGLTNIDMPHNPNEEPTKEPTKQHINEPTKQHINEPINIGKMLDTVIANPSMMAMAAATMNNINSLGKVPNQAPSDEELESVQEKPE